MMKRMFLLLIVCTFLMVSVSEADLLPLNKAPDTQIPPPLLKKHNLQSMQDLDLSKDFKAEKIEIKRDVLNTAQKTRTNSKYAGFLSEVSPEYRINKNFLSLTKVPNSRRKRSIMFVFLMNKDKRVVTEATSRTRMHILVPKRVLKDQKVVDDEYPVDVSLAKYEDGYAAGEWNLVLPNKKPREVGVSLLWSF